MGAAAALQQRRDGMAVQSRWPRRLTASCVEDVEPISTGVGIAEAQRQVGALACIRSMPP